MYGWSLQYYWRSWIVVTAAVHGSDKFNAHGCEYNVHDSHGRSIVVGSVENTRKAIDHTAASHIISPLSLYRYVFHNNSLNDIRDIVLI